ncbi:unnamed protein product [Discula destructiva]
MEPMEYTYYEETAEESADEVAGGPAAASPSNASSSYSDSVDSSEEEDSNEDDDEDGAQDSQDEEDARAPSFLVPSRTIAAVEHPFLVMNIDNALDSFGPTPQYRSILNPNVPQLSVPIYLHPKDLTSRPIMSHYASSHNVVFKITVPKRTGRKRKRGSNGPWEGEVEESNSRGASSSTTFRSTAKLDEARVVRRKLQDNVGRYTAEAVGIIKHTHRYRGMVDFNYSMKNNDFMNRFTDTILSRDVSKFREFTLQPGTDMTKNQAIIAPPLMTQITLPTYYIYTQNPYVKAVDGPDGTTEMINTTAKVQSVGHFISVTEKIPSAPSGRPHVRSALFDNVVRAIKLCLEERPIWTRRSIINRICDLEFDPAHPEDRIPPNVSQQIVKVAIQYAGYQFKGGPWRDAVVRYGYDPRLDPESRLYQCLIFRLRRLEVGQMGEMWQEIRKRDLAGTKGTMDANTNSHLFDGKTYSEDGKVWQVCDLTDPILAKLFREAAVRPTCDIVGSGWYHRGLWAKARAIMKCKMRAIQFGRKLTDEDFAEALQSRDDTPEAESHRSIVVPTPDLQLTEAEWELVRGKRYKGVGRQRKNKRASYHFPGNKTAKKLRKTNAGEAIPARDSDENEDDEDAGEEMVDEDVRQTIEDENGFGKRNLRRNVRFEVIPSDEGSGSSEDGSEYDEDEGSEDEGSDGSDDLGGEDFGYGVDQNQDELVERIRLARYEGYNDIEPGEDEDDEQQSADEDGEEEGEEEEEEGEEEEEEEDPDEQHDPEEEGSSEEDEDQSEGDAPGEDGSSSGGEE